jgi:N-acetyl sugar amidotransferase
VRYCRKCVQPDTRPGIVFDENGVCPACHFADLAIEVDWDARLKELDELADYARSTNVSGYDCVVTVSGGKDSLRQALYIRDNLGLKPLLVCCSYPPEQITEIGAHNLGNLISLGFDTISVSPDPQVWKSLMRTGFRRYGNWCKSTEMALYATGPTVAIAYHIPVIFYGENPAIAMGELGKGYTLTGDGNTMKYSSNTLDGGDPSGLLEEWMTYQNVIRYHYPDDDSINWAKLRMIYLGYYVKDFTRFKNAEVAVANGMAVRNEKPDDMGMVYQWESLDEDFMIVNQMIKHMKFGFGRTTEQVIEAARLGMMTREESADLVMRYDGKCADPYIKSYCQYLEISEEEFWCVAESYRNLDIWERDDLGGWRLKFNP